MGVSSSKQNANAPSSSEAVVQRSRSTRSLVFKSSCLRSQHSDNDEPQVPDCPCEENGNIVSCSSENKSSSCRVSEKCYRTDEAEQSDDLNCITSDTELDEWGESSFTAPVSRDGNTSSRNLASQPQSTPSGFLSRFSFYPGNLSFRLNRANSLGSARARSLSSRSYSLSNGEVEHAIPSSTLVTRNDRPQGCDFFPACFTNRSPRIPNEHGGCNNLQCSHSRPDFSNNLQDNAQINSNHGVLRNRNDSRIDYSTNLFSPINHSDSDDGGRRLANRRFSAREPADRNVRFSRTLSVGRLRDRVLRRTSVPDMDIYHFQEDREVRHTNRGSGRQSLRHAAAEATAEDYNFTPIVSSDNIPSNIFNSSYGSQSHPHQTSRSRETRYRDLLEHRSNFLDRRRRIRSQVRALQRLGSRFENLSGHERSCILSGQHRAGHCTCRSAAREANSNEDATARASISRIVMLAEALFEVLDEIHQQSVVLSSRPSVSSIGSIPAPNEVVDSLPSRIFSKLKRKPSDEAAQCYICLVDYEEGDSMRILPCHHEFHRACVDKWLKEIHRVCPLCRGDICRPESITAGS